MLGGGARSVEGGGGRLDGLRVEGGGGRGGEGGDDDIRRIYKS